MRNLLTRSTICAAAWIAGCVTTPVTPLDPGNYLVSVHTFYGLTSRSALLDKATAEAERYCATQGKVAKIKNSVGTGTPGLTNLSANIVFSCEAVAPTR